MVGEALQERLEVLQMILDHRFYQGFLGVEMVVDVAQRNVGLLGDISEGGAHHSLVVERLFGRLDETAQLLQRFLDFPAPLRGQPHRSDDRSLPRACCAVGRSVSQSSAPSVGSGFDR